MHHRRNTQVSRGEGRRALRPAAGLRLARRGRRFAHRRVSRCGRGAARIPRRQYPTGHAQRHRSQQSRQYADRPCRDRRRRHRPRGRRRGAEGAGRGPPGGAKLETTEYDLGAAHWQRRARRCRTRRSRSCGRTTRSCSARLARRPVPSVPSGLLERGLLLKLRFAFDHHVNLRPSKLYPGSRPRCAGRRGPSTSSWSARAPRGRTPATAEPCARAPPHEVATEVSSTPRTASSASSATRSPARRPRAQAS